MDKHSIEEGNAKRIGKYLRMLIVIIDSSGPKPHSSINDVIFQEVLFEYR